MKRYSPARPRARSMFEEVRGGKKKNGCALQVAAAGAFFGCASVLLSKLKRK